MGKRRTTFEDAPAPGDIDLTEAMIEREPITVVVSQKGWIRSLKGHVEDISTLVYKGDDALETAFFAQTTSKILVFASTARFSRSTPPSCRADAATASRSAFSPRLRRTRWS